MRSEGEVSRPHLGRALGISLPTITNLVKKLLSEELIVEGGLGESQGGRRATLLRLNPDYAQAIGVEVSVSGLNAVLMDLTGSVMASRKGNDGPVRDPERTINEVAGFIEELLAEVSPKRLRGIGVGIAGLVDREQGVSIEFPHSESWSNVRVADSLRNRFNLPVLIDNDVQAATLAELRYGSARKVDSFLYLHIGQGIRLGVVVGGNILHGVHGRAGEVGHVVVEENGPICYCGNNGCLESVASPPALVKQACEALEKGVESPLLAKAKAEPAGVTIEAVLSAAAQNDRLAMNLVERAGHHIGRTIADLANIFDPRILILAGKFGDRESPMMEVIERVFRRLAMPAARDSVEIRRSEFSESPCARGAATLVFDRMFEEMASS